MRVGNFSLLVSEGVERDSGHIALAHGKQYTLTLGNHQSRVCDAEVSIDGKLMDTFRLTGYESAVLERMPGDPGKLTFYAAGTADARAAGIADVGTPDRGLIQVRFIPEKPRRYAVRSVGGGPRGQMQSLEYRSPGTYPSESFGAGQTEYTSGGITGLSGHSDQTFRTAGPIDRDEDQAVTISVRLVLLPDGPRPLVPSVVRANPVPAPV